jgi:hypothetical protein
MALGTMTRVEGPGVGTIQAFCVWSVLDRARDTVRD